MIGPIITAVLFTIVMVFGYIPNWDGKKSSLVLWGAFLMAWYAMTAYVALS